MDFSPFFKTKEGAIDFSSRLSNISEKLFETDFNIEKAVSDQFGIQKKDKFMALLRESQVDIESNTSLNEFITKLQQEITLIPVVTVTIAFEPSEESLRILSEWFMINIKKQYLFDISVDRRLIAGAFVLSNGKYIDFSVKPTIDRVIQNARSQTLITPPQTSLQSASTQHPMNKQSVPPPGLHQSIESMSLGR